MPARDGPRRLAAAREEVERAGLPDRPAVAPLALDGAVIYLRTLAPEWVAALKAWCDGTRTDHAAWKRGVYARLVVACLCDPEGVPLLTMRDAEQLDDRPTPRRDQIQHGGRDDAGRTPIFAHKAEDGLFQGRHGASPRKKDAGFYQ